MSENFTISNRTAVMLFAAIFGGEVIGQPAGQRLADVFRTDTPGAQIAALQTSINEQSARIDRVVAEIISMAKEAGERETRALQDIEDRLDRIEKRAETRTQETGAEIVRIMDALNNIRTDLTEMGVNK